MREAGEPRENPHRHMDNMQTPQRKLPGRESNPRTWSSFPYFLMLKNSSQSSNNYNDKKQSCQVSPHSHSYVTNDLTPWASQRKLFWLRHWSFCTNWLVQNVTFMHCWVFVLFFSPPFQLPSRIPLSDRKWQTTVTEWRPRSFIRSRCVGPKAGCTEETSFGADGPSALLANGGRHRWASAAVSGCSHGGPRAVS